MSATITVREKAEQYQAPERATVDIAIDITGYDRERVHMQVANSLREVREDIERMRNDQDGRLLGILLRMQIRGLGKVMTVCDLVSR